MTSEKRLARPLYEALPWFYILCGLAALVASYLNPSRYLSFALGMAGFAATLGGIVVLLRRRDFRKMRADYGNVDSSILRKDE
jgi:hypothetical protein